MRRKTKVSEVKARRDVSGREFGPRPPERAVVAALSARRLGARRGCPAAQ